ncbi:MAG: acylphosphatase [Idiomarina sp.]|nr:acylphosphatase [Idiomarina sp.]
MADNYWRILVSGRVQGVSFRAYTQREAISLGLSGFVRNLSDGRVEIIATGSEAQLESLRAWCVTGSPAAKVEDVFVEPVPPLPLPNDFVVRYE